MIAALMLYSLAITTLLAAAASAGEHLLRLAGRPARFVWMGAMLASIGLSAARFHSGWSAVPGPSSIVASPEFAEVGAGVPALTPQAARATGAPSPVAFAAVRAMLARIGARPVPVAAGSAASRLDEPLLIGWVASSLLGLVIIALSALRLARAQPRWSTATVDDVPVLLSHDLGPAAIGLFRYRIVLPAWALELSPSQRSLVISHEREHVAAGDPALLLLSTVLVASSPWNAALWWMVRRLRVAIELDCDARVLRRRPDRAAYGALLLAVSERTYGGAMPVVALAEPVSQIERRIAAFTSRLPRFAWVRAAGAGAAAVALIAVACVAPHPTNAPAARASVPTASAPDLTRSVAPTQATASPALAAAPLPGASPSQTPDYHFAFGKAKRVSDADVGGASSVAPVDSIRGQVTGPDGPIDNALVQAVGLVSRATDTVHTGADGRYLLVEKSHEGDYMMLFTATGFIAFGPIELRRNGDEKVMMLNVKLGKKPGPSGGALRATLADSDQVTQNFFNTMFDGIVVSPDQKRDALAIIEADFVREQALSRQSPDEVVTWPLLIAAEDQRDSALVALVTSATDRAKLELRAASGHIRMVRLTPRPPHPDPFPSERR